MPIEEMHCGMPALWVGCMAFQRLAWVERCYRVLLTRISASASRSPKPASPVSAEACHPIPSTTHRPIWDGIKPLAILQHDAHSKNVPSEGSCSWKSPLVVMVVNRRSAARRGDVGYSRHPPGSGPSEFGPVPPSGRPPRAQAGGCRWPQHKQHLGSASA